MNLFGKKRIAQLEESLADKERLFAIQQTGWRESNEKVAKLEASELRLMGQIREMDQLIFNMAQCTSWEQMRPIFRELQAPAAKRMRLESDRIKTLLIPEMQKAYRK